MAEVRCEACGAVFGSQYALDRHKDLLHTDWEARSDTDAAQRRAVVFRCAFCGAEFRRNDDLRAHIDETHPTERQERARIVEERAAQLAAQKGRRPRRRLKGRAATAVLEPRPQAGAGSGDEPRPAGEGERGDDSVEAA